jgi:hypothetical protein
MLLTNIAKSKYKVRPLESIMKHNQLVERSRHSFTRLARFINQLMRAQLFCGPVTVQQCYTLEAYPGSGSRSASEHLDPNCCKIGKTKSTDSKAQRK